MVHPEPQGKFKADKMMEGDNRYHVGIWRSILWNEESMDYPANEGETLQISCKPTEPWRP